MKGLLEPLRRLTWADGWWLQVAWWVAVHTLDSAGMAVIGWAAFWVYGLAHLAAVTVREEPK